MGKLNFHLLSQLSENLQEWFFLIKAQEIEGIASRSTFEAEEILPLGIHCKTGLCVKMKWALGSMVLIEGDVLCDDLDDINLFPGFFNKAFELNAVPMLLE